VDDRHCADQRQTFQQLRHPNGVQQPSHGMENDIGSTVQYCRAGEKRRRRAIANSLGRKIFFAHSTDTDGRNRSLAFLKDAKHDELHVFG
jgi:hypothetical protein